MSSRSVFARSSAGTPEFHQEFVNIFWRFGHIFINYIGRIIGNPRSFARSSRNFMMFAITCLLSKALS